MTKITRRDFRGKMNLTSHAEDTTDQNEFIEIDEELLTLYLFAEELDKGVLGAFCRHFEKLRILCSASKDAKEKTIKIILNTDGGDVDVGLAMHDIIVQSQLPVTIVATGSVLSAGFVIFLAGSRRLMHRNAFLMTHKSRDDRGELSREESENSLEQMEALDKRMRDIILRNSRLTVRQLNKLQRSEEYIMAEEAVKWGLADEIL